MSLKSESRNASITIWVPEPGPSRTTHCLRLFIIETSCINLACKLPYHLDMLEEIFRLKCLSVRQATITQNGQINHLKQVFVFKSRSLGCLDK